MPISSVQGRSLVPAVRRSLHAIIVPEEEAARRVGEDLRGRIQFEFEDLSLAILQVEQPADASFRRPPAVVAILPQQADCQQGARRVIGVGDPALALQPLEQLRPWPGRAVPPVPDARAAGAPRTPARSSPADARR